VVFGVKHARITHIIIEEGKVVVHENPNILLHIRIILEGNYPCDEGFVVVHKICEGYLKRFEYKSSLTYHQVIQIAHITLTRVDPGEPPSVAETDPVSVTRRLILLAHVGVVEANYLAV
jgi:hypothetical protein